MGAKTAAELNPRTQHYEFLGPLGALFITLGVPATTYALYYGCSETSGGCPPQLDTLYPSFLAAVQDKEWWLGLWDTKAALAYLAWYSFCVVAWFILPGDWIEGVTMRTGEKKKYKINGTYFYCIPALDVSELYIPAFTTFLLTMGAVTGVIYRFGPQAFTFIYERWVGFITASIAMSVFQGIMCYIFSFRSSALLALGGNSGNPIYDVCLLPSSPFSIQFLCHHGNLT